jgi:hypothetical protein
MIDTHVGQGFHHVLDFRRTTCGIIVPGIGALFSLSFATVGPAIGLCRPSLIVT